MWIVRRRRSGRGSGPNNGGHRECDNESGTQKEEIKVISHLLAFPVCLLQVTNVCVLSMPQHLCIQYNSYNVDG